MAPSKSTKKQLPEKSLPEEFHRVGAKWYFFEDKGVRVEFPDPLKKYRLAQALEPAGFIFPNVDEI